ncbi:PEBP-like protein [Penicillium pulvis]|uniref:PEBP-like protein n=1 Tax=Penicillium pulvis TaxID=1562058 RepID=UPI00254817A6|nr:PEBP-like protein [Penicillium pulvis]KAJ5785819.1 PEBP-like protein [Penicillium pulvis]
MRSFTFAATAIATITSFASAGSLPSEIATIGEPSQVLNVTFKTSTQLVEVQTGLLLTANGNNDHRILAITILNIMVETKSKPEPNLKSSGSVIKKGQKYVFMMVDPDTNTTDPTSVALHTIVTNLTLANSSGDILAKYVAPEPSGTAPHNYTFLLFKQPNNFTVASIYDPYFPLNLSDVWNRVNFPLPQFLNSTGLDKPVAANWFQEKSESNSTTTSASGTATASSTSAQTATSSSMASPGLLRGDMMALSSILGAIWIAI